MKPLPLSTKQRKKLIKMCESLFPTVFGKYDAKIDADPDHWIDDYDNIVHEHFIKKTKNCESYELVSIHWFEFCMTYLSRKLFGEGDSHLRYLHWLRFAEQIAVKDFNPIDYLYEQFKKLNNGTVKSKKK